MTNSYGRGSRQSMRCAPDSFPAAKLERPRTSRPAPRTTQRLMRFFCSRFPPYVGPVDESPESAEQRCGAFLRTHLGFTLTCHANAHRPQLPPAPHSSFSACRIQGNRGGPSLPPGLRAAGQRLRVGVLPSLTEEQRAFLGAAPSDIRSPQPSSPVTATTAPPSSKN